MTARHLTSRTTKGAVIAFAALSLTTIAACGDNPAPEQIAAVATAAASVSSPAAIPSATTGETATATIPEREAAQEREARQEETSPPPQAAAAGSRTTPAQATTAETAERPTSDTTASQEAPAAAESHLPTSPGDYSEGLMQAWTSGDTAAMREFTTPAVVEQLVGNAPDDALLRTACEDDMCSYSTESGGRVTLTLDVAKVDVGAPQAVTAVTLDL